MEPTSTSIWVRYEWAGLTHDQIHFPCGIKKIVECHVVEKETKQHLYECEECQEIILKLETIGG